MIERLVIKEGQTSVTANCGKHYFEVCRQAERGRFKVYGVKVGKSNAQWVFSIGGWPVNKDYLPGLIQNH
jgi:hypothetical protein